MCEVSLDTQYIHASINFPNNAYKLPRIYNYDRVMLLGNSSQLLPTQFKKLYLHAYACTHICKDWICLKCCKILRKLSNTVNLISNANKTPHTGHSMMVCEYHPHQLWCPRVTIYTHAHTHTHTHTSTTTGAHTHTQPDKRAPPIQVTTDKTGHQKLSNHNNMIEVKRKLLPKQTADYQSYSWLNTHTHCLPG